MKKINHISRLLSGSLITLGCLLIGCTLHAQQIQYSAEAGINFAGAYAIEDGQVIKGGTLPGFQLGISAKKIINSQFSFQPSLIFVHGGTYRTGIDVNKTKYYVSLLRLPLDVAYQVNSKFFAGAGPFIGYAISGTHTFRGKSYKIMFGGNSDEDDSRRIDAGIDIMAGYDFNAHFAIKGCFDFGLINPAFSPLKVNSRCLGIMLAYLMK